MKELYELVDRYEYIPLVTTYGYNVRIKKKEYQILHIIVKAKSLDYWTVNNGHEEKEFPNYEEMCKYVIDKLK